MISNGYVATVAVAPATAPNTKLLFKKFEEVDADADEAEAEEFNAFNTPN
jgi:hypothetical protein